MSIMEKHANLVSQTGVYSAVIGGLTANELAAYGGLIIGTIGLLVNWYYTAKRDRREALGQHNRRRTDVRP